MSIKPLVQIQKGDAGSAASRWQEQRRGIKRRVFETIGTPPVERNTRALKIVQEEPLDGYLRRKVQYEVGDGEVISAYLLLPDALMGPAPAVLALHQTVASGKDEVVGLDGMPDFAYGHELAQRGYVVLAPDHLTAGERIYPGRESFDSAPFYERNPGWSMVGKNLQDSMAALDVLSLLEEVDPSRIGVIGHSHGGHNAIFAAAFDGRVKVVVSNCGMSVFSEEEERLEWSLEEGYIYIPKLRKYFLESQEPPFDLHEVAACIAPRPWLNISAYFDFAYGNQEFLAEAGVYLYQVYDLLEAPNAFSYFMHGNNHSFPGWARALAYTWLDRWLQE